MEAFLRWLVFALYVFGLVALMAAVVFLGAWVISLNDLIETSDSRLARSIRKLRDDHARITADDEIRAAERAVVQEAEHIARGHGSR